MQMVLYAPDKEPHALYNPQLTRISLIFPTKNPQSSKRLRTHEKPGMQPGARPPVTDLSETADTIQPFPGSVPVVGDTERQPLGMDDRRGWHLIPTIRRGWRPTQTVIRPVPINRNVSSRQGPAIAPSARRPDPGSEIDRDWPAQEVQSITAPHRSGTGFFLAAPATSMSGHDAQQSLLGRRTDSRRGNCECSTLFHLLATAYTRSDSCKPGRSPPWPFPQASRCRKTSRRRPSSAAWGSGSRERSRRP
jgi:hypothetical protein